MKKSLNLLVFIVPLLIACSANINQPVPFKAGISKDCSNLNLSQNKISAISVPDNVIVSVPPVKQDFKLIESTENIIASIQPIKDNKFLAIYNFKNEDISKREIVGKVFDKNGDEVGHRFKIADSKNIDNFKLIADKNSDYFYLIYYVNTEQDKNVFIKKFDLQGNQIGKEVQIQSEATNSSFSEANFSFDENGKNLIVSWVTYKFDHQDSNGCPFPFFSCHRPAIVPPIYYKPVINAIKFDDNLNFCTTRFGLDKVDSYLNYGYKQIVYIVRQNNSIFYFVSNDIKEINLDNNTEKDIQSSTTNSGQIESDLNIKEKNNEYYFLKYGSIYKTDKNFKIIKSVPFFYNNDLPNLDLKNLSDKIQISNDIFVDSDLNTFKYDDKYGLKNYNYQIIRLNDSLIVTDGNYFKIEK